MNIDIVVGSVLGASEYVAEAIENELKSEHDIRCHFQPNISEVDLNNLVIIVTSTHGAGDLPDNIQPFADDLSKRDVPNLQAVIIGLGDSSYDTFCEGASKMANAVEQAQGSLLLPVFQIDVLHHPIPEEVAVNWIKNNLSSILSKFKHP